MIFIIYYSDILLCPSHIFQCIILVLSSNSAHSQSGVTPLHELKSSVLCQFKKRYDTLLQLMRHIDNHHTQTGTGQQNPRLLQSVDYAQVYHTALVPETRQVQAQR